MPLSHRRTSNLLTALKLRHRLSPDKTQVGIEGGWIYDTLSDKWWNVRVEKRGEGIWPLIDEIHLQLDRKKMKADHTFTGRVLRLTSAAVLILPYDDEGEEKSEEEKVWLPLSQILDKSEELEPQTEVTLTIPRWLAQEKDMM